MPIELDVLTEKLREQGKTEEEIQNIVKYYDDYVEREDLLAKQQEQKLLDEEAANRSVLGSAASKFARGWVSAAKGTAAFKNNIIFGAINAFNPDLTIEEKKGVRNIIKNSGGVTFDPKYGMGGTVAGFDKVIEELDQNVRLTEFSTISESAEKGNYLEAVELAIGGLLETTPSIAAAYGGYGAIALFGMSVAGNKFDEEFEANPEQSIQNLTLNAIGTGALESTFELATRGLMKYTGLIANKSGSETAKEFLKTGFTSVAKKMGVAGIGESIGETATELSVMGLDAITLGKDIDLFAKETLYRLGDSAILGKVMGSGIGFLGSVNSAARNRAEFLLTPIDTKKQMLSVANEISKLTKDLSNTQTEEGKKIISDKINRLENNLVRARAEVSKALNSLNQEELSAYAKNQDEIIKLQQILSSNDPDLTKKTAEEKIKELQDQNYNLFVDGAKRHLAKNIETIKPAAEKLGVEIQEFATKQEFTENTGQDAGVDGFIQDNKIFINNERAAEVGAISVGSHELLHRIISSKLTNKNTKEELANGLINILREEGNLDVVQKRIDDSYKFDKNGNERKFDDYAEEYFTVFSDAIVKGDIQYKETVFQKILNFLNSFVNKFTPFKQAKFNTAQQAYDFVKDYSKNIQKGKVTEQAIDLAGQATTEVKGSVTRADRTALGNQIKALVPEGTTKQQYDSQVIGDVYNDLVVGDRLNGLIRGQLNKFGVTGDNVFGKPINNFVEDVKQRLFEGSLTRFNPETNNDLGGFVVSELQQFRIGDVVNRYRREQAGSLDVQIGETGSIRTPVADEVDIDIKTTEDPRSELKQGLIVNNERLVDKKLEGEIEANTIEIIEGVTPEINDKDFKTFVKDAAQQKSFKSIKNKLKNIEQFLEDNINVLFGGKNLPIATLVAMERRTPAADRIFTGEPTRLTTQKQIDKAIDEGDFYVENEKQGPSKYPRKKPTIEQVKNFFFNVGASTKGTRKDGLVNAIAFSLFRDMAPGVMNRSDIMQEDIAKVSAKLVVDPTIKFSLSASESSDVAKKIKENSGKSRIYDLISIGRIKKSRIQAAKEVGLTKIPLKYNNDIKDIYDRNKELLKNLTSVKGETVIQGGTRIINNFLLEHPRYYNFLKNAFTFGIDRSMFGINPIWNKFINPVTPDIKKKKKGDVKLFKGKPEATYRKANMAKNKIVSKTWIEETKKEGYIKKELQKSEDLINFIKDFDSYLNKEVLLEDGTKNKPNTKDTWFLDEFAMHSQNSMTTPTKTAAGALTYEIKNGNKNKPFNGLSTEEHFDPQNEIITALIGGIKDGNFEQVSNIIRASYIQGLVSDANNDRVNEDFKSTKPDLFYEGVELLLQGKLKLDPGLLSVIRYTESDVNLNNLYYIPTKQTYGEYFFDANNLPLKTQKELIQDLFKGELTLKDLRDYGKIYNSTGKQTVKAFKSNLKQPNVEKYSKSKSNEGLINDLNNHDKALRNARDLNAPKKGISIFDFDDTVATSKSMVIVTMPDGKTKKITPAEFAKQHSTLEKQDAEFDFSEFNKVVDGKPGPLAAKIKKQIDKFGNKDVYILTARPQASASAIKAFLDGIGIKLPLKNITGLEDGTPQAKANWVIGKAAEGYNDFYFTDDVYKNVKAVQEALEVLDVKSKTRLAYADRVKKLDKDFNDILEATKGVASEKEYSKVKAELLRGNKGRYEFFIHASADDFAGMLQRFQGKGVVGDNAKLWFKKNLLDPFATAMGNLSRERIALMNDYDALKAQIGIVPKNLRKKMGEGIFTNEHAVRVYIWNKQGMEVPGLSKRDSKELTKYINDNKKFKVFADQLIAIHKADKYPKPDSAWVGGTITIDMQNGLDVSSRAKNLQVWEQNVDIIFSDKNLNKIEALYGQPLREALTGMIKRMKTGKNRSFQSDTLTGKTVDFLNGAVGGVMFFNSRSSVLQTISLVNFINYEDNNIFAASKAFANQKQFWKDFKNLMNSDFLIDRRRGVRFSLNENDIANIAQKHGARGVIARALEIGFLPTQIADSFAIAVGGASFYRNRINTYKKQGLSDQQAEAKAFQDFREIAEETQQSSRPDRVSQQQAGPMGRLLLAFQNVTMQFNRVGKKNFLDLKNSRRVLKSDGTFHSLNKSRQIQLSKMGYYFFVQNLIFNGLQKALFALYFGDIDEEDEKFKNKYIEIGNSMGDSILRGLGIFGGVVSVLKNAAIMHQKQSKLRNPKYEKVGLEILKVSPPISSKITKVVSALRTLDWDKEEIKEKGFSIDNPALLSATKLISAFTNAPLDRVVIKTNNIATALGQQLELWERIALLGGWQAWELGIEDEPEETKGKVKFGETRQTRKVKRRKKELIIK